MAWAAVLLLETGPTETMKGNFCLEAVPAGPPDGALIVQASTQPGAHLVAHEQALLGGTRSAVASQKGCFKMLFGVEVVLQLQCHSSIPRGVCLVEIFYMGN